MGILAAVLILLAADACGFTNVLHRPLIACTLIGAAVGAMAEGITTGILCELALLAASALTMEFESGAVLLYAIFASACVKGGMPAETAAAAGLAVLYLGNMIAKAVNFVSAALIPSARKAASEGKDGTLGILNLIPLVLSAAVYTALGIMMMNNTEVVNGFMKMPGSLLLILSYAGILLQCLGLAVLLRNIGAGSKTGLLLAGFGTAVIALASAVPSFALAACAAIALAVMMFVYEQNGKDAVTVKNDTKKGGNDKWW